MKPTYLALTLAATLMAASLAGVAYYAVQERGAEAEDAHNHAGHAGADTDALYGGHAGDGHHNGEAGMHRPSFAEATGTVPTAQAAESLEEVSRLQIHSDGDFVPANGVRSGNGTLADPYIITGYYVTGDLYIADTDACFIVKENYVGGQLSLNWNGQCTHVHHNYIRDLRVNENIRRDGRATGGLMELNKISFIGQLRHYDGEFRNNVVGPFTQADIFDPIRETVPWMFGSDPRVANVDGFNQGMIHNNTFYGSVDLDFHGHHHGTGFFASHSHYHGDDDVRKMAHDHTQRWTSVAFEDNLIVDPEGYGLRYEDRAHAGDDRLANSEQEETLDEPHIHYTHIAIERNVIEGGQLWVDVFNADDNLHYTKNPGWLDVKDNIVRFQPREESGPLGLPFFGSGTNWFSAMHIDVAKEVELVVTGNELELLDPVETSSDPLGIDLWPFDDNQDEMYAGIALASIRGANITLERNIMTGFDYGISAHDLDESTHWTVSDNDYGDAQYPIYYDDSVANQPAGEDV